ncbi:MAG: ThuA domain-containing protein [Saprospiraceae bacterium]|nr:ThuA domain-containing protein [Saprospiraceae bacterium]
MKSYSFLPLTFVFTLIMTSLYSQEKLKALIIDGESNHGVWPMTSMMMKDYLVQTGLFEVDIARTHYTWQGPHYDKSIGLNDIKELLVMYPLEESNTEAVDEPVPDPNYKPSFFDYDVLINNFGWKASTWPDATKEAFELYMKNGGGMVVIHAANNSWGDWDEYNKMIGLGGWGGRNKETGPYVYYNDDNQLVYDPTDGTCGFHGPQHEYVMTTRAPNHPIMMGLPEHWLHTRDELYSRLRGPAENMTVLATAYSDKEKNGSKDTPGTGRNEPLLMAINYGKGRIFHTGLGHMDYSMECVGFITTFQRGAEWAATGRVTQEVPKDFPKESATSSRKWKKK